MRSDLSLRMICTGTLSSAYCDGANTKQLNISELHGLVRTEYDVHVCTSNPREALSSAYCDGATTKQLNISELHGLVRTGLYEVGLKLT